MSETGVVKGYKVFNPEWTCRDKQYACPGKFEENVDLSVCNKGMHFCKKAADCFNYYPFNPDNKVAEVIAYGSVVEDGDKCCTDNRNSGDWNRTNFSNGCFNTVEPKIYLFNKPSEWTYSDWLNSAARALLNQIPTDELEYVWLEQMTDAEKKKHPYAKITGGYLKKVCNSKKVAKWWESLDAIQKATILELPNFDKAIFKEITGIDVDKG